MAAHPETRLEEPPPGEPDEDPTIEESSGSNPALQHFVGNTKAIQAWIHLGYTEDSILSKVIAQPAHHPLFTVEEGLIHVKGRNGGTVLCIPHVAHEKCSLTDTILGHFRSQRTVDYIR
ncbi:hypothetical protein PAXINDRAFT_20771 [Paxillus involutus ATCC 200175]|uniref:Uncharacterized protein n=1 Tax=Paxillus involutus ATCC 200175 TaxID=664439 RepID=A0A0C9SME0_PAXIN|nr:hypothetical protein PAXINDRAFT_20771 [Paxillus involutus ATCC 200175]